MANIDKHNKTTRRDRLRVLRNGIQLHLLSCGSITIAGTAHTVDGILAAIDDDIAKCDAAEKGHAAWLQQVEEERASHRALDPVLSGVRQYVRLHIGDTDAQQAVLADFGLTPRRKPAVSPKTQVAAAEKARATRALLHTMGSNQKKQAKAHAAQAYVVPTAGTATATPTKS
jgi:hypothetical protein